MSEIEINLRCPQCRHQWLAAIIVPESWWGQSLTAETCAKVSYCPRCECQPPMDVVGSETSAQGQLFT